VFRVAYRSILCPETKSTDIQRIVAAANARNADLGITGVWMLSDGDCLAAIEGPPLAVREIMDTIWDDPRHTNVKLVAMEQSEDRLFDGWALRFLPEQEIAADPGLQNHVGVSWLAEHAGGVDAFYGPAQNAEPAGAAH
jgi:acylphosphatase